MYRKQPFLKDETLSVRYIKGDAVLERIRADALCIEGRLFFKKLVVDGKLFVSGEMVGEVLECNILEVHGVLRVEKMKSKTAIVNGNMHITQASIDHLELITLNSTLDDSTIGTLVVKPYCATMRPPSLLREILEDWMPRQTLIAAPLEPQRPQILFLRAGSKVEDVIFEQGDGIVYVDSTSKVMGKVIGGRVFLAHSLLPASILFSQEPCVKSADTITPIQSGQSLDLKKPKKRVSFAAH